MKIRPLLLALAAGFALAAQAAPVTVKIIGFNDYHGTLQTPGTFGQNLTVPTSAWPVGRPAVGGAEFMAGYVAAVKAVNPNTVVVGAGDLIGATPLISALFFDEPAVETLNQIGLDFSAVGNHEFDKGKAELLRLQNGGCKLTAGSPDPNSCRGFGSAAPGSFDGAKFKWLSANVVDTSTGRTLLPAYGVKTFGGVKVAFIGMTLKGTPGIVTPTGVAGLSFQDEADTVNVLVPKLRAQGIESIVVLIHQGGFQNLPAGSTLVNASDINGCLNDLKNPDGSASDIANVVSRLDNAVDLVISGHTHAAYNCSKNTTDVVGTSVSGGVVGGTVTTTPRNTGLPNKVGRLVPVTSSSAFGRVLTEIDLTLDTVTRNVVDVSPRNVLVNRNTITPVPAVASTVASYNTAVSPLSNAVIATITAPMSNAAAASGEMPAGDLIADAQLAATQPAGLGGAVMAFMNAGGVRNPGFNVTGAVYPYNVTYGNAFTVQPFGNSLVTMTLTTQQIKDVLEQQFALCNTTLTNNRIMQISNGLKYDWSSSGSCGTRIRNVSFTPTDVTVVPPAVTGAAETLVLNGVVQNPAKTYRVTVNNFMATGGDGFSTFIGGTSQLGGAQDIDALVAYLAGYKAPLAAYNPADPLLSKPRITVLP